MNDRGKVSVGKVQQNDLAFRINASSREVLRKCLKGIIITKPKLEGEGSVDKEAPEQRGFRAGVDLHLGAIDTTNVNRFRGRRRKKQSEKSQAVQIYQIYEKRVHMLGNA